MRLATPTLSPSICKYLFATWEGHMVKGLLTHGGSLFWNLSADVGPGQPNRPDDVEFVRFGYFLLKDNPKATSGTFVALKAVCQSITPTGAFRATNVPDVALGLSFSRK